MLVLTLAIGRGRYAIDVRRVIEVVPRIPLRPVPHAEAHIAGLFNHGGAVVPVVDLGVLMAVGPCPPRLSTRIILVEYPAPDRTPVRVGLIAERTTELLEAPSPTEHGPIGAEARVPYLGPLIVMGDEMVQMLWVDRILPSGWSAAAGRSTGLS
jgi:chemotaxis-related protein WspB